MNSYSLKIKTAAGETSHQLISADFKSALKAGKKAAPKGMDVKIWIYYSIDESAFPIVSARRSNGKWTNY